MIAETDQEEGNWLHTRQVLGELEMAMPARVVSTDIGNINSVANSYLRFEEPRLFLAAALADELCAAQVQLAVDAVRAGGVPAWVASKSSGLGRLHALSRDVAAEQEAGGADMAAAALGVQLLRDLVTGGVTRG
jgi:hypothetical protein